MDIENKDLTQAEIEKRIQFEKQYQKTSQRILNRRNQKQEKDLEKNPEENMKNIQNQFNEQHFAIQEKLNNFQGDTQALEKLFEQLEAVKNFVVKMNHVLTSFDKQQYKEQIEKLESQAQTIRQQLAPRKKFAFSKKSKNPKKINNNKIEEESDNNQDNNYDAINSITGIDGMNSRTVIIDQEQISSSYKIVNSENSTIILNGTLDCIYIKNNKNCTIKVGPIKSSIHVTNCNNCELQLCGHQIRIHDSNETLFKIFSSSKSIIENCSKLKFAEYDFTYKGFEEDFKNSGLSESINLWNQIQDFNWHKLDKSPNFDLIY